MEKTQNQPAENRSEATRAANDAAIEAYLDRLCGPLKRVTPARREEIRREVQGHLQMLMAGQDSAPDALQKALAQFGEPEKVGRAMARRAQWDDIRLSWRAMRWTRRFGLLCLGFVCFWGAAMTVEFYRWMSWGGDGWQRFVFGPLLPLTIGCWWGTRESPTRRGYLIIAALSIGIATLLPIPHQYSHADMDSVGMMDLSACVRFTVVLMWLWTSCSACGLARMLLGQSSSRDAATTETLG